MFRRLHSGRFAARRGPSRHTITVGAIVLVALLVMILLIWRPSVPVSDWFSRFKPTGEPGVAITVGKNAAVSDAELGVRIYPDSIREPESGIRIKRPGEVVTSAAYTSPGDAKDVVAFYAKELPGATSKTEESGRIRLSNLLQDQGILNEIDVTVTPKAPANDGMTRIFITHTMRRSVGR